MYTKQLQIKLDQQSETAPTEVHIYARASNLEISLLTLASLVDYLGTRERILQNCRYQQP